MKVAITIVAVFSVVATIAFLFLPRKHMHGETSSGFTNWVKDPENKRSAAEHFAALDAVNVPENISDAAIKKLVDSLFERKFDPFNKRRLELLGRKAIPQLLAALEEPRTRTMTFADGSGFIRESPFARICELVGPHGSPATVPSLTQFVDHPIEHFRRNAALPLGNIGSAECVPAITKLLDDDDDYVRSFAMIGIERGIRGKHCTPEFLSGIFPALVKLLNRPDKSVSGNAPELLLIIDRERAIPILLSPEYFSSQNTELHYILRALNKAKCEVPLDQLRALMVSVEQRSNEYPFSYTYAECLIAYARKADAGAKLLFRQSLSAKNERVREAAAQSLAILSGVENPSEFVFEQLDDGWDAMSEPQRLYYAVLIYDGEVNNGGHSQYFVNSSGDFYPLAIAGLKAIKAPKRARILSEALALFGDVGPSQDNDRRHDELASFTEAQDRILSKLDDRYYACDEDIDVLLALYALDNKEHFRRAK